MHTLSLGLPDDPESESLPFLHLEWDPQFPPTPAPANGQSADGYFFSKDKEDSHNKNRLSSESCNGQSSVWEGCSTGWLTKDAEASGIRTAPGDSGDGNSANKNKEKDRNDEAKREDKKVDDIGGGGGNNTGHVGGKGDDGNDGEDDEANGDKNRKMKDAEDEESSHEPSSDSSEG
ncbi:hypothetical protein SK128_006219, partial [Halocaridina rubra]